MASHTVITRILERSRANPDYLAELEQFRRNVAVMFTDIKGSTAYFEKYGDVAGFMMVHECNESLERIAESHGGRVIKTIGDAIMAIFENCGESVNAAIEMQNALVDFNASKQEQDRVYVRIGVHYGAGIVKSNDVFGDVVNVASRVESVASPEQIVISDTLHEQVRDCGLHILGLGRFVLKGKEGERNLFEVIWDPRVANRPAASHTIVTGGAKFTHLAPYKLLQLRRDGSIAVEYELKDIFTIGRAEGDVEFPSDSKLAPVHARFVLESGQVFVEDLSQGGSVYVRLVGPYTLAHEDTILMGRQLLQFHEQADVMTAAAAVGGTVVDATAVLSEPVAELVLLSPSTAPQRFPIDEEQVTFGRTRGTYTFPDDGVMSRAHARIYQRGEDFYLEDTASRNGTFIKVRGRAPVPLGAVVLMGGQLFQLAQ